MSNQIDTILARDHVGAGKPRERDKYETGGDPKRVQAIVREHEAEVAQLEREARMLPGGVPLIDGRPKR